MDSLQFKMLQNKVKCKTKGKTIVFTAKLKLKQKLQSFLNNLRTTVKRCVGEGVIHMLYDAKMSYLYNYPCLI